MNRGYIKIWRKVVDCEVLHERGKRYSKFEAWVYLCLEARGTDDPESGLKRGELEASYRYLAKAWLWSVDSVFRFMRTLEDAGMLKRAERLPEHLAEHFIICNYELYNQGPNAKPNALPNETKEGFKEGIKEPPTPLQGEARELYEIYQNKNHRLPKVKELTDDRLRKCRSRINQAGRNGCREQYLADFSKAVEIAQQTPFLCGENERHWQASFDWFTANQSNIYKVLEGRYGQPIIEPDKPKPQIAQHITKPDGSVVTVLRKAAK